MIKLPADLFTYSICPIRRGETSGLRGVRGGAEGMGAHMRSGCGLSGRSSGRRGCRSAYLARRDATCEAAADSLSDVKLAACKSPRAGKQITRTAIAWSGRLEDRQHPLCAVRRPRRDGPPVGFAECLRRAHTPILSAASSNDEGLFAKPPTEAVRSVAAADRVMMLVVPIAGHVRKRHRTYHTESSKGPFVDGSRADAAFRVR